MNQELNVARLRWDLKSRPSTDKYDAYWGQRNTHFIPMTALEGYAHTFLEIGAGTGWFFVELAKRFADTHFVAVERCRTRGNRLVHRAKRAGLTNLSAFRGNAIPAIIHGIPDASFDRVYILYPCPWPKTSQRKNRWYLHPIMPHLVRILKPGGLILWASDQEFYIREAHFVSEHIYGLKVEVSGQLAPNAFNHLALLPEGRTKFEHTFLQSGQSCFELVVRKS
jgi:tRNA (guanine-N7-)-methyltransferase